MSHAIQNIAFILNNLFQEQHAGVIKPTGRLGSAIESTVGVALLWRGWLCYLPAGVLYLRRSVRWWVGGGGPFGVGAGGKLGAPVSCYNNSRDI